MAGTAGKSGPRSEVEIKKRLAFIDELISVMVPDRMIVRKFEDRFGDSRATAHKYIRIAYRRWQNKQPENRGKTKEQVRIFLLAMIKRSVDNEDDKLALEAVDRLCKIEGLFEPEKVHHTGSVGAAVTIDAVTSGDRRAALKEMLASAMADVHAAPPSPPKPTNGANGHGPV